MNHMQVREAQTKELSDTRMTIKLWEDKYAHAMNDLYSLEVRCRQYSSSSFHRGI